MDKKLIVEKTEEFVKKKLYGEGSGHDWFHIERVYNLSKYLAEKEHADSFTVEMTALLHDIDDWKFSTTTTTNTANIENFLKSLELTNEDIEKIVSTFDAFEDVEKYATVVDVKTIKENDCNLNISRYVDTTEEEEQVDIQKVLGEIAELEKKEIETKEKLNGYLRELGFDVL